MSGSDFCRVEIRPLTCIRDKLLVRYSDGTIRLMRVDTFYECVLKVLICTEDSSVSKLNSRKEHYNNDTWNS